jgi:hypothetical protein
MPSTPAQFGDLAELCLFLLIIPSILSIALMPFAFGVNGRTFGRLPVFLLSLSVVATSLIAMVGSGSCLVGSQLNHQGICRFQFKEQHGGWLLDPSVDFVELQLIYGLYFVVATSIALSGLTVIGLQARRLIRERKNPDAE